MSYINLLQARSSFHSHEQMHSHYKEALKNLDLLRCLKFLTFQQMCEDIICHACSNIYFVQQKKRCLQLIKSVKHFDTIIWIKAVPESYFCGFQDEHLKCSVRNILLICVIIFHLFQREFELPAKELPMLTKHFLSMNTILIIFTISYKLPCPFGIKCLI